MLELRDSLGVQVDLVNFDDASPWPNSNNASSIYLTGLGLANNAGTSWARSAAGVADAISPSGPAFSTLDIGSPGRVPGGETVAPLPGDYNANNVVDAADYTVWRDRLGTSVVLSNDTTPGSVGPEDYTEWKQHFGMSLPTVAATAQMEAVLDDQTPTGRDEAFASLLESLTTLGRTLRWPGFWGPRGTLEWNPSKEPLNASQPKPTAHQTPPKLHG